MNCYFELKKDLSYTSASIFAASDISDPRKDDSLDLMRSFAVALLCLNLNDGKRRLNFASFTSKEHLNFPAASRYYLDIIVRTNFITGQFNADYWQILKAVFQTLPA